MSDTNDDMVLVNPFGREVTVPNELGQELILESGFEPKNKAAKDARKDPQSLAFTSQDRAADDNNPAKITEDIKSGKATPVATPAVEEANAPDASLPKGDAASEGKVEAPQAAPKKRGSK